MAKFHDSQVPYTRTNSRHDLAPIKDRCTGGIKTKRNSSHWAWTQSSIISLMPQNTTRTHINRYRVEAYRQTSFSKRRMETFSKLPKAIRTGMRQKWNRAQIRSKSQMMSKMMRPHRNKQWNLRLRLPNRSQSSKEVAPHWKEKWTSHRWNWTQDSRSWSPSRRSGTTIFTRKALRARRWWWSTNAKAIVTATCSRP